MEKRKVSASPSVSKASPLPLDYLKMVRDVFNSHFDAGLKIYGELKPNPQFEAKGEIHSDEIVLAVSLRSDQELAATTVYASIDFDPKASVPGVPELLGACVDAVGGVFGTLLAADRPEVIAQVAEESLAAIENVPFDWTSVETGQRRVFVKVDKSNLSLDAITQEWLLKNDPDLRKISDQEARDAEDLFITGKKT